MPLKFYTQNNDILKNLKNYDNLISNFIPYTVYAVNDTLYIFPFKGYFHK